MSYQVGAYYFPNYHVDPRNEAAHGPGWTEWELVKRGEPRFAGHGQPKVPLWGYEDESDPAVFSRKIDAAADHGINHFIFDWYWYNDGPFLNRGLDIGYMGAANNSRLKFALMWANHDWTDIHPAKLLQNGRTLHHGAVTRETFDAVTDFIVDEYFRHPSYWTIDGCPYFSIYELMTLVNGLGGYEAARDAIGELRAKTRAAGFPDLHLNAVVWGVQILPNEQAITDPNSMLTYMGFDSITSYVWIHHVPMTGFPTYSYLDCMDEAERYWHKADSEFVLPYHPNVTMGWDSSPRTCQSDTYINAGYPFCPVLSGNTPDAFREALTRAKSFLDRRPNAPRILNINAWNEWTEGSYLEPDTINGMSYLEAIGSVFGR